MKEKEIKIIIVEPNKIPYVKTVENDLKTFQNIVGGYIECVMIKDKIDFVCNEEGKILELPKCRYIEEINDIIAGTFFMTKADEEGNFTSLSEKEIETLIKRFSDNMNNEKLLNNDYSDYMDFEITSF
jgi:hypothetical protein